MENQDWATGPSRAAGRWAVVGRGPWAAGLFLTKPLKHYIKMKKKYISFWEDLFILQRVVKVCDRATIFELKVYKSSSFSDKMVYNRAGLGPQSRAFPEYTTTTPS